MDNLTPEPWWFESRGHPEEFNVRANPIDTHGYPAPTGETIVATVWHGIDDAKLIARAPVLWRLLAAIEPHVDNLDFNSVPRDFAWREWIEDVRAAVRITRDGIF